MRRPDGAGGAFFCTADVIQRLILDVETRMFHLRSISITAFIILSMPRPCLADRVTMGKPLISGKMFSMMSSTFFIAANLSSTKSHLLKAKTIERPSRETKSQSVRSCFSMFIEASTKTTTQSAYRMARIASVTESFSSFSFTLPLRRMPAVSHSLISRSPNFQSLEIASRVMPASGPVSIRSSPSIVFTSVDLPALGWPMMARRKRRSGLSGPSYSGSYSAGTNSSSSSSAALIASASASI